MTQVEKIVLLDIYGLGKLDNEKSLIQLHVALNILQRIETKYSRIPALSREPDHDIEEILYLGNVGIENRPIGFTAKDYDTASIGTPNAVTICYMIHGNPFEDYILANLNNIDKCIFVANEPKFVLKAGQFHFKDVQMLNRVYESTKPAKVDDSSFGDFRPFAETFVYRSAIQK